MPPASDEGGGLSTSKARSSSNKGKQAPTCFSGMQTCKQSSDDLGHSLPAPRGSPAARRARWRRPTSARAYRSSPRRSSATRGECCGRRVRVRAEVHAAGRAALSPFRLAAGARAHAARVGDAGRGHRVRGFISGRWGRNARARRGRAGETRAWLSKKKCRRGDPSRTAVSRALLVCFRRRTPAQARGVH